MPAPLRIAIVCEFRSVNGGEQSLLAALEELRGAVVPTFLAPTSGPLADRLRDAGWVHHPWAARDADERRRPTDQLLDELTSVIVALDVALVHGNSLSMGRLTGRLAACLTQPCTAHLRDIVKLSRAAIEDLNGNARLFAVSAATRAFHTAQGVAAERTEVLYNGVDLQSFRPAADPAERHAVRRELGVPADAPLALTIGQIGLRKGWDVLVAAAPELFARIPRLHWLGIGERYSAKAESREFEQQLRANVARAGLADRMHWLGRRDDIPALLRAADLLIHPARQEPFGRVLLEAAAAGLPIVATNVGGTSELLTDGETARLVCADDPQALAAVVAAIVADDRLARRLGRAARLRVQSGFGIAARAQDLCQAWTAVNSQPPE